VITGNEGEVYVDEIPDGIVGNNGNRDGAGNNGAGGFIDRPLREQLLAIHSQLLALTRKNAELRGTIQNNQRLKTPLKVPGSIKRSIRISIGSQSSLPEGLLLIEIIETSDNQIIM
jgi:hypothetical protein